MIMNTPSPHNITLSAVARRFSLVWLMLLLGTLSIFAQSASDFSVTVVSTPSTCVQNGKVEIKGKQSPWGSYQLYLQSLLRSPQF